MSSDSSALAPDLGVVGTGALAERVRSLLGTRPRVVVGLAGAPGAGKSTLAGRLVAELGDLGAVVVPFDGFHLADRVLRERGLLMRKGAPETFDLAGYANLVERCARELSRTVYAPAYDRSIEEPVAGAVPVAPGCRVVLTEGNYLLLEHPDLQAARRRMDQVWFLDLDEDTRTRRLRRRHVDHGKTEEEAQRWTFGSDQANAALVAASRASADVRLTWEAEGPLTLAP